MLHRLMLPHFLLVGSFCLVGSAVDAQQIYRWTDANGKVNFGNQPPSGAKGVEAKDREKSETTIECEKTVKKKCQQFVKVYEDWMDSDAYRECFAAGQEECARWQPKVQPTQGRQRVVSTPTLPFDPTVGDSLLCEMRCRPNCRGQLEIRADRVLKTGENLGSDSYSMQVKPPKAGSAYCTASTRNENVQLVLSVMRGGTATAMVEAQ
jgi:hypothetical protein